MDELVRLFYDKWLARMTDINYQHYVRLPWEELPPSVKMVWYRTVEQVIHEARRRQHL